MMAGPWPIIVRLASTTRHFAFTELATEKRMSITQRTNQPCVLPSFCFPHKSYLTYCNIPAQVDNQQSFSDVYVSYRIPSSHLAVVPPFLPSVRPLMT
jgi:hypothetical protein